MLRTHRKSIAVACIAVLVCVALLPGLGGISVALFEPTWVLLLDLTPRIIEPSASDGDEQLVALSSTQSSRAPPAIS